MAVDPEIDAVVRQARDALAVNVMWGYLLEMAKAGIDLAPRDYLSVAAGVRAGHLPDHGLLAA